MMRKKHFFTDAKCDPTMFIAVGKMEGGPHEALGNRSGSRQQRSISKRQLGSWNHLWPSQAETLLAVQSDPLVWIVTERRTTSGCHRRGLSTHEILRGLQF